MTNRCKWMRPACMFPAVTAGLAAAFVAFLLSGAPAAAAALVAGTAAAVANALWIARQERAAGALLRRPELRSSAGDLGVFGAIVGEAVERLEQIERQSADSTARRMELEARGRIREKLVRQLRSALECVAQPVLATDMQDQVLFCNGAAARLLAPADGPAAARGDGGPPAVLAAPLRKLLEETRTRRDANDRRAVEFEWDDGGGPAPFRAVAFHARDEDGTPLAVITLLENVAEERRAKTRHAEFVSSVCHELKTPMAGIRAYTEMLMDGDVSEEEERQELYGFIDGQVDRLTRLVNNMLNLARIESGVVEVRREDCELNDVLQKALDVVRQLAEDKSIRLHAELSDLYLAAHVDRDLFGQAVINLLSNAIKYTPEGGEVRLGSRMEEAQAVIEVQDNGMGIPPDSLARIFERFYRVPENNKAAAGTGLGLSLVHYIVTELHNGRIDVASEVDQGTCFTVAIPLGHRSQPRRRQTAPALCTA